MITAKQMKPLTKEQQEYIRLKLMFDRMAAKFKEAQSQRQLPCSLGDIPKYCNGNIDWIEIFFYQRLEQLKQEKLNQPI